MSPALTLCHQGSPVVSVFNGEGKKFYRGTRGVHIGKLLCNCLLSAILLLVSLCLNSPCFYIPPLPIFLLTESFQM